MESFAERNIWKPQRNTPVLHRMGVEGIFLELFGCEGYANSMRWKASHGDGNQLMVPCTKPRWRGKVLGQTPRTGEKKGSKRHVLVDAHGVPLSIVVTGANRHDVSQLEAVLQGKIVKPLNEDEEENLCADAGYVGAEAHEHIIDAGYTPHVRPRGKEKCQKQFNPSYKPRRWVVEVCHSWFNRFRKSCTPGKAWSSSAEVLRRVWIKFLLWFLNELELTKRFKKLAGNIYLSILQKEGSYERIKQRLTDTLEPFRKTGRISNACYEQALGRAPRDFPRDSSLARQSGSSTQQDWSEPRI